MPAAPFLPEIEQVEELNWYFSIFLIVHGSRVFSNPVTYMVIGSCVLLKHVQSFLNFALSVSQIITA